MQHQRGANSGSSVRTRFWLEYEIRVLEPFLAQHLFAQGEYRHPGYTGLPKRREEVTSPEQLGIGRHHHARTQRRMLHEVASDEVVLIPDPPGMIGVPKEEQPGVADSPGGEHGESRLDRHRPPRRDQGAHTSDAARDSNVPEHLCDVCPENDLYIRGRGQAIVLPGIDDVAVLKLARHQRASPHWESAGRVGVSCRRLEVKRIQTEVPLCPLVVRNEVAA